MNHHIFSASPTGKYPLVFLVPSIRIDDLKREYVDMFGLPEQDCIVLTLHQAAGKKKTPVKEIKTYIQSELVDTLTDVGAKILVVGDGDYFKALTGTDQAQANLGYVMDCVYGPFKVVYVPNYRTVFYDPIKIRPKIAQGMNAMLSFVSGSYQEPGKEVIKFEAYPETHKEIEGWLQKLLAMDCDLTCDIEAFSLKHHNAGIGTITFCWNKHEGVAFHVDLSRVEGQVTGIDSRDEITRSLLRDFFIAFQRKLIFHSIGYDATVLIYQLFMRDICDTEGLLDGMGIILRDWDCTKLITYLATNSCAGNKLGLKEQAQEYAGNYAVDDIADIKLIPVDDLLRYNLVDGLSTWFVKNKWWDKLVNDQQLDIYENLFKPSMLDIIQMQLTGMPINMKRTIEIAGILEAEEKQALNQMMGTKVIQKFNYKLNEDLVAKKNSEYKVKRITLADVNEIFNPNSGPQLQTLLFDVLGLPVLSLTDSKQPSTDGDTLKLLLNHTTDPEVLLFLKALTDYKSVNKILTSFIPAMLNAVEGPDGWHYLFGNFNLGGTLSGRLSSSDPNLQTIPASSKFAKLIKSCFEAPPGWLYVGLDFASLEDKISGLTTKDPNKLKVYTSGFDGHCLRAQAYFSDQMPDILVADEGEICYQAKIGTTDICFTASEVVEYLGQQLTGKELYELLSNSRV